MNIIVIGAAVIDLMSYPDDSFILKDSNPGNIFKTPGGVGRNIAENLARLNLKPTLITALGDDEFGRTIINKGEEAGINFVYNKIEKTPAYLAVLDQDRDMHVAIFDGKGINEINVDFLKKQHHLIGSADIVVIETNLSEEVLEYVFNLNKDIYVDTISTKKAIKLKPYLNKIKGLKMNEYEAAILSDNSANQAKYFIDQGVDEVFITMGKKGSIMATKEGIFHQVSNSKEVVNATGAGDAYLAGIIYAKVMNLDPLKTATACSLSALLSEKTVSEKLSRKYIEILIKEYKL